MEITSEMIKRLREKTGAGMMDCKRALESTGGDIDAAIDYLRKKGAAVAQKRADRSAKEGVIVTRVSPDGRTGVMVEVNCETDFVARSTDFTDFVAAVAETLEHHLPPDVPALLALTSPSGKTLSALLNDLLAKVGEKIDVRRFEILRTGEGVVSSYTHLGNKIGVLVEFLGLTAEGARTGPGRDVAMQVAAMSPMVIQRSEIAKGLIDGELEVYRTQAKNEGKPAHIVDKIASGRLEKFYQEVCLMEQTFIKDSGKTVKDYLQEAGSKSGKDIAVTRFRRYHLGEEAA